VIIGLDLLDARLDDLSVGELLRGQTDSERYFALITGCIQASGGDVDAGLLDAVEWLAANVPIFSANLLLSTATDMWAVRYPVPD
jgi:hypothetical protein